MIEDYPVDHLLRLSGVPLRVIQRESTAAQWLCAVRDATADYLNGQIDHIPDVRCETDAETARVFHGLHLWATDMRAYPTKPGHFGSIYADCLAHVCRRLVTALMEADAQDEWEEAQEARRLAAEPQYVDVVPPASARPVERHPAALARQWFDTPADSRV